MDIWGYLFGNEVSAAEFLPSEEENVRSRQRSIIWSELLPPAGARETWDIFLAVVLAKI